MAVAFIFPGQGSQQVGMGRALAETYREARAVFDEVDEALGEKLSDIVWQGPDERLTLTANAQPALMAVSLAVVRVLEAKGVETAEAVRYVAGHSLGEYSALAAAGALTIADTARLVRLRGSAMQTAVPVGEGAMAALIGLDFAAAVEIADAAAEGEVCQAANDNAPGQVVVSGAKAAVERAIRIAADRGARRALLLPVSAPFHCALMAPAADAMAEALAKTEIRPAAVPVVCNVTARPITAPDDIRKRLVEQVTRTVRWRESVAFMAQNGIDTLYELGAGKVLTGLARRIDRALSATAIGTPEDIEAHAADLA
jgi:[acyl-carrier-protein] S-malonyltransferase